MKPRVVLVAGTHSYHDDWWKPESLFAKALMARGMLMLDRSDPFVWCTKLDGIIGKNDAWESSGLALKWYTEAKRTPQPLAVIAHSHGGQVAAYAAARGLRIDCLVTAAMPVRADMERVYLHCANHVHRWVHLHSDKDFWQILGALFDGRVGIHRQNGFATHNVLVPKVPHSEFVTPALWEMHGLFELLG